LTLDIPERIAYLVGDRRNVPQVLVEALKDAIKLLLAGNFKTQSDGHLLNFLVVFVAIEYQANLPLVLVELNAGDRCGHPVSAVYDNIKAFYDELFLLTFAQ